MPINYFSDPLGTKAQRIDLAWSHYTNKSQSLSDRQLALDFMLYAFDIEIASMEKDSLNSTLTWLMALRNLHKSHNPEYVPLLRSGQYQLETQLLHPTRYSKKSPEKKIQEAFDAGTLLDVNKDDKREDVLSRVPYKTPQKRTPYDIEIHRGLFYQSGELYDSSALSSHDKKGYVAFTLNANGDLSVFKHMGLPGTLAHSSMNAGAPVLAAGEMEIRKGKLISVNTYSGHYEPSLYSIARFLEYLNDRGIDIAKTNVYLQSKPKNDLQSMNVMIPGDPKPWFQVKATDVVHNVKAIMNHNIASIHDYSNSHMTLFKTLFKKSTKAKSKLAADFQNEMNYVMQQMQNSSSRLETKNSLDVIESIITRYSDQLNQISKTPGRLTNKFNDMKHEIQTQKAKFEHSNKNEEGIRIDSLKKSY